MNSTTNQPLLGQLNRTGNMLGRCSAKGCKHSTLEPGTLIGVGTCPEHGRYSLTEVIGAHVESVKCGARCTGAVGPACDCSCGGANHGTGHAS